MANKKDGITDLTKLLVIASKKLNKSEYSKLTGVVFAMLHGVNYGYNEMDQKFLNDAADIFVMNHDEKKLRKKFIIKKNNNKSNIIKFSDYIGAPNDG